MVEFFRVTYYLKVRDTGDSARDLYIFERLALRMAEDGAVGTWISPNLAGLNIDMSAIRREYGAKVEYADFDTQTVVLKFPLKNIDAEFGAIPLLLNTVAGDILGYPEIERALVLNIDFPEEYLKQFRGPACGVEGIHNILGVTDRPIVAFSVKPRLGLAPEQFAILCKAAIHGGKRGLGVDIVEDDERLLNPLYCPMEERVKAVAKALKEIESETGKKLYSVNISGRSDQVVEKAKRAIDLGANALKIDVLATGFSALQAVSEYLHEESIQLPLLVYPGMYSTYEQTISREVLLHLSRLAGADVVYSGAPPFAGRMDIVQNLIRLKRHQAILSMEWPVSSPVKRCLPSVTTGIQPGNIDAVYRLIGNNDFAYFVGGGIAGHPEGIAMGAEFIMRTVKGTVEKKEFASIFNDSEIKLMDSIGWEYVSYEELLQREPVLRLIS